MQLLEALHIVNGPNATGQRVHILRLKAQGQHFLDAFLDALLNALLNALLDSLLTGIFGEVLGKGGFADEGP